MRRHLEAPIVRAVQILPGAVEQVPGFLRATIQRFCGKGGLVRKYLPPGRQS
jgi:hypothetical protein